MSAPQHDKSITEAERHLEIEDFDYELPPGLIAQEPAVERTHSRLMVLNRSQQTIEHKQFFNLSEYLKSGDLIVLNNTKVIPARIMARRQSGGVVEVLLLKPEATRPGVWQAMASPLRKLKEGDALLVTTGDGTDAEIKVAGFFESADSQRRVYVDFGSPAAVHTLLSKVGQSPLPPYIRSERTKSHSELFTPQDLSRYQTVFAKVDGAVAAPTAGLHFSEALFGELREKGVDIEFLTLHVGAGTFKPISGSVSDHTVESEEFFIRPALADKVNSCKAAGGRVIAVGTTSCRALETAGASGKLLPAEGIESHLYISPGHDFKIVDCLVTNFHLSRSSLLVLVSAFGGHELVMSAYREAIERRYRFYSYGDAMFIF